jgi:hypothetical protein
MFRHFFRKGGWTVVIFLAFAAGFGFLGLRERSLGRAIDDHGVATLATIEGMRTETRTRRTQNGPTRETDYLVTYAFAAPTEVGAAPVRQRVVRDVPGWVYDDLRVGQRVEIRYLPERPSRIEYFAGESRENALFLMVLFVTFLIATSIAGVVALRQARRAHRLDIRGVDVLGTIHNVYSVKSGWNLWVQFVDAQGTLQGATLSEPKGSPWAEAAKGTPVALRFDPAEPRNVALAQAAPAAAQSARSPLLRAA